MKPKRIRLSVQELSLAVEALHEFSLVVANSYTPERQEQDPDGFAMAGEVLKEISQLKKRLMS